MKSLKDFNTEMFKYHENQNKYPKLNGIECPKCKSELMDLNNVELCSYPP